MSQRPDRVENDDRREQSDPEKDIKEKFAQLENHTPLPTAVSA